MSIEEALNDLDKKFGKGSIMRYGDQPKLEIKTISTGLPSLDKALGIGGLPLGRIVEVYGPESSGKTTLALHALAECQKTGGKVAFVDAEHSLDPNYASKIGVDMDNVYFSQPDSGEQALEIVETLARSQDVSLIVIDSVAALVPRAELDGEMGDSLPGLQARLMSQAMRKLTSAAAKNDCLILFINQLREKIGVMFGSPETTTGGKALKFYTSVRLDIRRIGALKNGEQVFGNRTRVKVVKNKMASPFREVEFDLIYGEGISKESDLIDSAINRGIIIKKGAWLSYDNNNIAQGKENARKYLQEHPDICEQIKEKIESFKDVKTF